MASMQNSTKAHLALLGTNIFFAINYSAVKYLINQGLVKPFGLNLVRVAVTAILLWVIFLGKPVNPAIRRKDLGRFVLCALTGIAINQLLFIKGLSLTYSIHASLLMLTTPILITFIAAWLLKERINGLKIAGLLLGITGAVILVTAGGQQTNARNIFVGDLLILINAFSYTIYFVLVKPLMREYNPVTIIRMIFTIGLFMILPFCWTEFREISWQVFSLKDWFILGMIVFGGTFLAYLFNVYGIKILGASIAGAYIYSQPVFATIVAIIFLGETIEIYKIIAALFIFAGVYLANKSITNA